MTFIPRVTQLPTAYSPPQVAFSTQAIFNSGWDGEGGLAEWQEYQAEMINTPMKPGPGFKFFAKYIGMNDYFPNAGRPVAEAHIVSRAHPQYSLRLDNTLEHYGFDRYNALGLSSSHFLNGQDPTKTIEAFQSLVKGLQLYITTDPQVARNVILSGFAAATLSKDEAPRDVRIHKDQPLVVGLDGDSVIFDDASESVYQLESLRAFQEREAKLGKLGVPLVQGPLHPFLIAMHGLRRLFESAPEESALLLKLFTARGRSGHRRVVNTIDSWDVQLDHESYMDGGKKGAFLRAAEVDMFFDDSMSHILSAREHGVMAAHVPFGIKNKTK